MHFFFLLLFVQTFCILYVLLVRKINFFFSPFTNKLGGVCGGVQAQLYPHCAGYVLPALLRGCSVRNTPELRRGHDCGFLRRNKGYKAGISLFRAVGLGVRSCPGVPPGKPPPCSTPAALPQHPLRFCL